MLEETADELQNVENHGPGTIASGLTVAEEDLTVFDLDNALVGNSHPEDIRREVLDRSLRISNGLGVDIPVGCPHFLWYFIEQACLDHVLSKDCTKNF